MKLIGVLSLLVLLAGCGGTTQYVNVPQPYPVPAGPSTNITCAVYDLSSLAQFNFVPNFDTIGVVSVGTVNLGILNSSSGLSMLTGTPYAGLATQVGMRCTSQLIIPTAGTYQFNLSSDDGSLLYINGYSVVVNDGLHGYPGTTPTGSYNFPTADNYNIEVDYYNNFGPSGLTLSWDAGLGGPVGIIPASSFQ